MTAHLRKISDVKLEEEQGVDSVALDRDIDQQQETRQPFVLRRAAINPNHWYAVARDVEVGDRPLAVTLWHQSIVLFRDGDGVVRALENRCPHRQVQLSHGQVVGDRLVCAYHGWEFDGEGRCVDVPYLGEKQRLPRCGVRRYPVLEQDGFIWVFPGDVELAEGCRPLPLPEWEHLNYIAAVTPVDVQAHFSFLIENLMDMYHGHLHDDLQAWANPKLASLESGVGRVDAHYDAESYYTIDKIYSISQLFFKSLRKLHPAPLDVSYVYPNWVSTLGDEFKIVCLFCPVSETQTRAYLMHLTSLKPFWRLHKLPVGFRRWVKDRCFNAARGLLAGLVQQDVVMIEEEQASFESHPERRSYELNPAVGAVKKLIRVQADDQ
ncbi:MAG: aromatic ring-hydroxylating dioxygenase subunit alpha [Cyanobacteria bacterium J06597_1]